jgi:predicted TIM-barrel fold metal-dependent hydrolase
MQQHERYSGPLVDSHHHIWRKSDLAWLSGTPVPRIFGPYEPIRRDYLIDEYVADAEQAGIAQSVYVQTNWPEHRELDEVRWVQDAYEASGWPTAVVGEAPMFSETAPEVMRAQAAASPLVVGTRLQLHWHERPEFRFASAPDTMKDPVFLANVGFLRELGWLFELQVFTEQMADAAELVARFPDTTFMLVHAGMLVSAEQPEIDAWTAGMKLLAAQPNVVVKLTGQGTFVHRVDPDLLSLVAGRVLELFGPERAMFGTNFPVESIWTAMGPLVEAWRDTLAALLPVPDQALVLAENARRVYGLREPGTP